VSVRDMQDLAGRPDLAGRQSHDSTLPAVWYTSQAIADTEQERIFSRGWRYIARSHDLQHPGDFVTAQLGHVPVVLTRGEDAQLRAFVNVCRHRGAEVAQGSGNRKVLRCPYHAWTYDLDGSLRVAPRSDLEGDFCREALGLVPVQVAEWGPLVFANLDLDAEPVEDRLSDVARFLADGGLDLSNLEFDCRQEWELSANWKVAIEGFLECYHCPLVHPETIGLVETNPALFTYRIEEQTLCVVQPAKNAGGRDAMYANQRDGEIKHTHLAFLWPNTTFAIYPGRSHLYVDTWIPVGAQHTRRVRDRFFSPDVPRELRDKMIAVEQLVSDQDVTIVASVQRGLNSGLVAHGRLLLESEPLVHRFQTMVAKALAD
jgi:phenylpropionate dioxygenase-like ring-hydroxylating dioxygenase large terminal subunit